MHNIETSLTRRLEAENRRLAREVRELKTSLKHMKAQVDQQVQLEQEIRETKAQLQCLSENIDIAVTGINRRRMVEHRLHVNRQRYRSLFHNHPDLILEFDTQGNIVSINETSLSMIQLREDEIVQHHYREFLQPEDLDRVDWHFKQVLEGKPQSYLISLVDKDGTRSAGHVTNVPIIVDGEIEGAYSIIRDVTENLRMQEALQESEKKYRLLVEQCPIPIGVHRAGHIVYLNPSGCETIGVSSFDEIEGKLLTQFIHPDMVGSLKLGINCERVMDLQIIRTDGVVLDVESRELFSQDGDSFLFYFQDVTERNKTARVISESEEHYRKLAENSPFGIAMHKDGHFTYINQRGIELLGLTGAEEILGTVVYDLLDDEGKGKAAKSRDALFQGDKSTSFEVNLLRKTGEKMVVEVVASYHQERKQFQFLFHDVTERKKAEQERLESQQQLRKSQAQYLQLQESLDRFSTAVYGVVKVSELERRLIKEVSYILQVNGVTVAECGHSSALCVRIGTLDLSEEMILALQAYDASKVSVNYVKQLPQGGWIMKLGELKGNSIYLCIEDSAELLKLQPYRVWLETLARYVHVLYQNFYTIEDLSHGLQHLAVDKDSPTWFLRMLFNLSENERKRLAQDLHDAALQEQIVYYRKLENIVGDPDLPAEYKSSLDEVKEGLLDIIYQIRITCNELRPPLLQEFGLVASLESMIEMIQLRNDFIIHLSAQYDCEFSDEMTLSLYRIVQELLHNASKHSNASDIYLAMQKDGERLLLIYEDNGIGMDLSSLKDTYQTMGVYGIKERVRSLNGTVQFESDFGRGLKISIELPAEETGDFKDIGAVNYDSNTAS